MGPLSILLRTPFAWLAARFGAGELGMYRAGIVPCLVVAGLLGIALARRPGGRDWNPSSLLLVPVLAIISPASLAAMRSGHPEEALGGALCVGAVLLALGKRATLAGVTLGLAVATKQWALIAVVPTVLALPQRMYVRTLLAAAVTAAVFYVPFVAGNPTAFLDATRIEAHIVDASVPETVWLLASHDKRVHVDGSPTLTYHAIPHWVVPLSHSAIVLIGVPILFLLRKRRLEHAAPLALLALFFLFRCVFDPADQDYFHLPFVLALLAWEVVAKRLVRGIPIATLVVIACLWLTFDVFAERTNDPWLVDAWYILWTGAVGLYLLRASRLLPSFTLGSRPDVASV